jgi:hypothetical protein
VSVGIRPDRGSAVDQNGRLLCVVPEERGAAFTCSHRDLEAKEYLGAFGKDVITALERLKLMALSSIPRAEFSDAIALRQSQVFCRCFH